MSKIEFNQLPKSVQDVLKVMRGETELKPRPRIKPVDFLSYKADEIFPNSPEMQRYFNKQKEKRKNL
ncbi:hypothetical protein [Bacillus sp. Brlt_9]|uniref:hypothetical protein n=1 Tax=Bacillus sp. Brlt_9 TaxID=3110916 RepID=UPI003F7C7876